MVQLRRQSRLAKEPDNAAVRTSLIYVCLTDLNAPAEAAKARAEADLIQFQAKLNQAQAEVKLA